MLGKSGAAHKADGQKPEAAEANGAAGNGAAANAPASGNGATPVRPNATTPVAAE